MRQVTCWLVLAACLPNLSCTAAVNDAFAPDTDLSTVLRVADNRNWYVQLVGDSILAEGTIASLRGDELRVDGQHLTIASVDSVLRRGSTGGGGRSGVITGAVAGGASFGLLTAIGGPATMLAGAILGGVAGGVIGGIAGSLIRPGNTVWETVWRR
ncbi:MAG TPA: hypothetical protein VHG09_11245 [Longimicrobiales bacterium]|nr:hypothetical protein [Longimicrobiales bacterium]